MKREENGNMWHINPDVIISLIKQQEARIAQQESCIVELEARLNQNSRNNLQIADFERGYSQIIEGDMRGNPVPDLSDQFVGRGRKKQSKAKNLLDLCQKYQREILLFMHDLVIPFSNNQAEQDIRMVKLQQKISGTFRNEQPVLVSIVKTFEGNPFLPQIAHRST